MTSMRRKNLLNGSRMVTQEMADTYVVHAADALNRNEARKLEAHTRRQQQPSHIYFSTAHSAHYFHFLGQVLVADRLLLLIYKNNPLNNILKLYYRIAPST